MSTPLHVTVDVDLKIMDADLVLRLIKKPLCCSDTNPCGHDEAARSFTTVRVKRACLLSAPASTPLQKNVFTAMLRGGFSEARKDVVDLEDSSTTAMLILLRNLHGIEDEPAKYKEVTHVTLYHLVEVCNKYNINYSVVKRWHNNFLPVFMNVDEEELLFPLWKFDNAAGFTKVTKSIVYNSIGAIKAYNPTGHPKLNLPSSIEYQLNAAKGRLRTVLNNELFRFTENLILADCDCSAKVLKNYLGAIHACGIRPFRYSCSPRYAEMIADGDEHSVIQRLCALLDFKMPMDQASCLECDVDFEEIVKNAVHITEGYFHGLCLDCMNSESREYINRPGGRRGRPRVDCRISKHGEPTQYFSMLGKGDAEAGSVTSE